MQSYAVNGALHYGMALLRGIDDLQEVIIVGLNGSELDESDHIRNIESKAYYLSRKMWNAPKHIKALDNTFLPFRQENIFDLYENLDELFLSDEEKKNAELKTEIDLERNVKAIHQRLYDDEKLKTILGTNDKLYLFCGLIRAGLPTEGMKPLAEANFEGNDDKRNNDSEIILRRIASFLEKKNCAEDKRRMVANLLAPIFQRKELWKPYHGESYLKNLYIQVKYNVMPHLLAPYRLDFTGKILNNLSDWVALENNIKNDVVLTPRYVASFMARLCQTDMNSFVWDRAMGSAGFLVAAMDIMIRDAEKKLKYNKKRTISENPKHQNPATSRD